MQADHEHHRVEFENAEKTLINHKALRTDNQAAILKARNVQVGRQISTISLLLFASSMKTSGCFLGKTGCKQVVLKSFGV